MKKQYIFTPGPVPMTKNILSIGKEQVPYFRNEYFSNLLTECKINLLKLTNAQKGSEVIFLASSGTGAMEATIINLLDKADNSIIVNGGGFGQRFVDICISYKIPLQEIRLKKDENIDYKKIKNKKYNSFVINAHETTIGRLYDLKKTGEFCKKNNLLHIVDAISAFVCDEIDMKKQNIDALILSSNKGLALPPGLAMVILSPKAIKSLKEISSLYFNFKFYLKDIKRGQTPFTPTVSILKQLHKRLEDLEKSGIKKAIKKTRKLSLYFRNQIKDMPFDFYVKDMPNAMTTLLLKDGKKANKVVEDFEKKYNIILTPSGGELKEKVIRISHMGNMDKKYVDVLIHHLKKYYKEEK